MGLFGNLFGNNANKPTSNPAQQANPDSLTQYVMFYYSIDGANANIFEGVLAKRYIQMCEYNSFVPKAYPVMQHTADGLIKFMAEFQTPNTASFGTYADDTGCMFNILTRQKDEDRVIKTFLMTAVLFALEGYDGSCAFTKGKEKQKWPVPLQLLNTRIDDYAIPARDFYMSHPINV